MRSDTAADVARQLRAVWLHAALRAHHFRTKAFRTTRPHRAGVANGARSATAVERITRTRRARSVGSDERRSPRRESLAAVFGPWRLPQPRGSHRSGRCCGRRLGRRSTTWSSRTSTLTMPLLGHAAPEGISLLEDVGANFEHWHMPRELTNSVCLDRDEASR